MTFVPTLVRALQDAQYNGDADSYDDQAQAKPESGMRLELLAIEWLDREERVGADRVLGSSVIKTTRPAGGFTRTLERQIEEIMSQVAPRRQSAGAEGSVVTVLFARITDYVSLCQQVQLPEIGAILDLYLESVADSVGKFLGSVQIVMGDTVLATWNATYPQTDHALLAVNSALDMVERAVDVNGRLRLLQMAEIGYSLGINTGSALVGRSGRFGRPDEVNGDAVNLALQLSLLAGTNEILVGKGTEVSVGIDVCFDDLGLVDLDGTGHQVHVFRVGHR